MKELPKIYDNLILTTADISKIIKDLKNTSQKVYFSNCFIEETDNDEEQKIIIKNSIFCSCSFICTQSKQMAIGFYDCDFISCSFTDIFCDNLIITRTRIIGCKISCCTFSEVCITGVDIIKTDIFNSGITAVLHSLMKRKTLVFTNDTTVMDSCLLLFNSSFAYEYVEGKPHYKWSCPKTGSFIAYKPLCMRGKQEKIIAKVRIPEDAQRISPLIHPEHCRSDKIEVLAFYDTKGNRLSNDTAAYTGFAISHYYPFGEIIVSETFNNSIYTDMEDGIKFYMTFEEALEGKTYLD